MKKIGKILIYFVVLVLLVIIAAVSYVTLALPNVGAPEDIKIAITPERVARGKYLANNVSMCMDCHSQYEWTKPGEEVPADKLGSGGRVFDEAAGLPGTLYSPNITPYKLAAWTDGEIFRAITTGVRKDGSAIFPIMQWPYFAKMDREDLYSIIAYLRTLKPVKTKDYPKPSLNFPVNLLVHTMPRKAPLGVLPSPTDTLAYGAYLANAAVCRECHSKDDKGTLIPGKEFSGGREFKIDGKLYFSSNITPDRTTGIGSWSADIFVQLFKSRGDTAKQVKGAAPVGISPMPWYHYSGMKEGDLRAIFAYLHTIKPISNRVISN